MVSSLMGATEGRRSSSVYSRSFKSVVLVLLLQRNSSLPDDTNVARLQEELIAVKLREAEALTGLKELRQQVRDLEDHWQVSTNMRVFLKVCWAEHDGKLIIQLYSILSASLSTYCRSLEGRPQEEYIK